MTIFGVAPFMIQSFSAKIKIKAAVFVVTANINLLAADTEKTITIALLI